ncbi:MAG: UbiA prenyltransferase family protein [Bacteroidia bacterium]|jgi:4-hydroxybenzoate polyprenyltransferase|nr:UbiA prenyltransferase family protein [Bacteroidia bacterium]
MLKDYLALIRPGQHIKNLVLFLPAFFAERFLDTVLLARTFVGFVGFSLLAGGVYILNDYRDIAEDRAHPVKQHRPLAAGRVSPQVALLMMAVLMAGGVGIFAWLDKTALYVATGYVIMNLLYSFRLKHIAILDVCLIALGFEFRIAAGALIAVPHIPLSLWIVIMIFLGALFLALAKRRDDVRLSAGGLQVRKAIHGYNLEFINATMVMMASVMIVSYIFYTISPEVQNRLGSRDLYVTVIFVLMGVMRYMQITFVEEKSANPGRIFLEDRFMQLVVLGWIITLGVLIYGF